MSSAAIQLLVLAGVAVFLVLKLRGVLGTREGYEKPVSQRTDAAVERRAGLEVIEGGPDRDITDHIEEDSAAARALYEMKEAEPEFSVSEFLEGARGAYEMILMGFERGDMDQLRPFLSDDVFDSFVEVVAQREDQGLKIEAEFIGMREVKLLDAKFDPDTREGEMKVRFIGELTSLVRDKAGDVIEGEDGKIKRQKDIWTFARPMGTDNPNWQLVATGE